MTAAEREQIRATVERTCLEQNIPLTVPPEVCVQVAQILRSSTRTPRKGVADAAA